MSAIPISYPITPQGVDETVLQPSKAFKQEVTKVLFAIFFFMIVYLLLMVAALLLAFLCGFGGVMLVTYMPKFFTLMIGIGLVGLGVMVIFFLLKFLFKKNKVDRSHLIEIKEHDQPALFSFIRTLTQETASDFPKKIYISSEVNASVFYDSSFWSMFLPIRKNLQIGLGLVNSVNLSEFKAILAHEFGHFSQRSMKLGSYVYNVNQIIYNLLYDNDNYGQTLERWANISGYFAFFANITIRIVIAIQWILQKVYAVVNKSYMALSRQMEFHADAVSAYVSGSDHLITSLRRLEVADNAYNRLFEYYDLWHKQNLKPDNLYPHHIDLMNQFAREQAIPVVNGLPQVNSNSFARFNKARLVIKDQWASHPSTEDREAHLNKLNIRTETVTDSAWALFRNAEALQKQVTEKIYSRVNFENPPQALDLHSFRKLYATEVEKYQLNHKYKGFFNYRNISVVNLKSFGESLSDAKSLEDILNDQALDLPYIIEGMKTDIHHLDLIQQGVMPVKNFEFNGNRYKKTDAAFLSSQLNAELADAENQLKMIDAKIISFFIDAAAKNGQSARLIERYSELFQTAESAEADLKKYSEIMEIINPIFYNNLPFTEIHIIMAKVKNNEIVIKERLKNLMNESTIPQYLSDQDKKTLEDYLSKNLDYFREPNFNNDALMLFNQAMHIYQSVVSERSFTIKKNLLEWQLSFVE
ncbi:M48 family metallopeptidase [Chryseolinea sp. H1M3-3]|uniref:M48 family metallopeptidase n=1 Tax=Chryseolinea sp. H1M3-3 TaxID=3034144 RepID=UPI0023EDBD5B|nr:M48 family metallopeptidase [Chryseolinea sp. H1M3-3]